MNSKVLEFKKNEGNVLDFQAAKSRRDKRGMSYEDFMNTFMKDSIVSLFGNEPMSFFNKPQKEETLAEVIPFPSKKED